MGNDLYWMITPKPQEPKTHQLHYSTWHFLAKLWGKEAYDMAEIELTEKDIAELRTIGATARHTGDKDLAGDMKELVSAIEKYDSITLVIHG